jgi:hypothetical protein
MYESLQRLWAYLHKFQHPLEALSAARNVGHLPPEHVRFSLFTPRTLMTFEVVWKSDQWRPSLAVYPNGPTQSARGIVPSE